MTTFARRAIGVCAILLALVGCGSKKNGKSAMPTPTYAEAVQQAHVNLQESLKAFPEGTTLGSMSPDTEVPCTDQSNPAPGTPVEVSTDARLDNVDHSRWATYLDDFTTYWTARGWHITTDQRAAARFVILQDAQSYVLNMQVAPDSSVLTLSSATPCVPPISNPTP